ncbi:Beta-grasp domain-containing protein [Artemisia annua]|uniref:Beta-grasp domain-containing protein n=1 Tax=Artemisia annua TaxID=35608 RepID=A0A2U1LDA1_ARTAN|nr:Beta-grasp domain-containing protein [Artemisia annua]
MGLRRGLIKYWSYERFSCDVVPYHDVDIGTACYGMSVYWISAFLKEGANTSIMEVNGYIELFESKQEMSPSSECDLNDCKVSESNGTPKIPKRCRRHYVLVLSVITNRVGKVPTLKVPNKMLNEICIINSPERQVLKAIAFARNAHNGQLRKTGDPYLTHCINTAKILALLVPTSTPVVGQKAIDTIVSGILHDVVDDTSQSLSTIELEFGQDIAKLVAGVSRLSYINQLLRRHRRTNVNQATFGYEEANNLRVTLLGMVDGPRVVLIKLADRLHNMRTIYALPSPKAKAVAQETWSFGNVFEFQPFQVMIVVPRIFRQMRSDQATMSMTTRSRVGNLRRLSAKNNSSNAEPSRRNVTPECEASLDDVEVSMKRSKLNQKLEFYAGHGG